MFRFLEKEGKPIPMKIKREVYERAKGKCKKCGARLEMNEGDFHHTGGPTVTPSVETVSFFCPLCYQNAVHHGK